MSNMLYRSNLEAFKPVFYLATLFARHKAKTRIRHRDCLILAGEKIRREQQGTVPTFLSVRANKFAKWKTVLNRLKVTGKNTTCCTQETELFTSNAMWLISVLRKMEDT